MNTASGFCLSNHIIREPQQASKISLSIPVFILIIRKLLIFFAPVSVSLRNNAFAFTGFLVNFMGAKPI